MSTRKPEVVINMRGAIQKCNFGVEIQVFQDNKVHGTSTDMKFYIVLREFYLHGCLTTTKPEVLITMCRYTIKMHFDVQIQVLEDPKVSGTSIDMKFCTAIHEFYPFGCMATTKPDVLTTMRRHAIEIQFRRIGVGSRRRRSQWNIDRHEIMYSFARFLPKQKQKSWLTGFQTAHLLA